MIIGSKLVLAAEGHTRLRVLARVEHLDFTSIWECGWGRLGIYDLRFN